MVGLKGIGKPDGDEVECGLGGGKLHRNEGGVGNVGDMEYDRSVAEQSHLAKDVGLFLSID